MEPLTRRFPSGPRRLTLPFIALLLAGCMVGVPGPAGGPGTGGGLPDAPRDRPDEACTATAGQLVMERVNAIRREHGLGGLAIDARLVESAQAHTRYQAVQGTASHAGSGGSALGDRVSAAGYGWGMVSENVAAGYPSADAVMAAWMNSVGHRATILSPEAVDAGVGYVHLPDRGSTRHYWTLNVARPLPQPNVSDGGSQEPPSGQVLACHP